MRDMGGKEQTINGEGLLKYLGQKVELKKDGFNEPCTGVLEFRGKDLAVRVKNLFYFVERGDTFQEAYQVV